MAYWLVLASKSLNALINDRPIAAARLTGTAFPICLYSSEFRAFKNPIIWKGLYPCIFSSC